MSDCMCAGGSSLTAFLPGDDETDIGGGFFTFVEAKIQEIGDGLFEDDPGSDILCGIRDLLPPPVRAAFVSAHQAPFSIAERVTNWTVGGLVPTVAALAFPPALPFAGMLSVPFSMLLEAGRFARRAIGDCGVFAAMQGEAQDTLTMLDFWTPQHPVGKWPRLALELAGGGFANGWIDKLNGPLRAMLQPLANGHLPSIQDVLNGVLAIFGVLLEMSDEPLLAQGSQIVEDAADLYCVAEELTGGHCGATATLSVSFTTAAVVEEIAAERERNPNAFLPFAPNPNSQFAVNGNFSSSKLTQGGIGLEELLGKNKNRNGQSDDVENEKTSSVAPLAFLGLAGFALRAFS